MTELREIYGHCTIPKNTLLFRGHTDISFNDCMFFSTKHFVANNFSNTIQVWKTKRDIELLFLVEYLNIRGWAISSLPNLFNFIFPSEYNRDFDDLDIKHRNINRRDKLVQKLFEDYNTYGWLTSLENRIEIEICLFNKQANSTQLKLIDTVDRRNKKYFKDSLERIKIFPSMAFYSTTNEKLNEQASFLAEGKDHYKRHKRKTMAFIKNEIQAGKSKIEAKHYLLDLRTKLKI